MSKVNELLEKMTLEEKASLISGDDFWHTKSIDRLQIPSMMVADGPHGVRKQAGEADSIGLSDSVPATCFPTGAALACTWNENLLKEVGVALGKEANSQGVQIVLGPAVNIKRSPLCGRNFEYYSEDPYLTKKLATAYIQGVQSQGVGTSIKHYVANNQEHRRMTIDAEIDERTLREIYLEAFEEPIRIAKPWSVMCGYNKVNGELLSENRILLHDVLRGEWGYQGFVVSDWGAVDDRVKAIKSGLDLEMPGINGLNDHKVVEAVKEHGLDEITLDKTVERILKALMKEKIAIEGSAVANYSEHHDLGRRVAEEGTVLLKNVNEILPISKHKKVAIIGEFAKHPRYQGGGSSLVHPTQLDCAYDNLVALIGEENISYSKGYDLLSDEIIEEELIDCISEASNSDVALLFVGLPDYCESEGFDRTHMQLPLSHNRLIEEVCKVQKETIVVLSNGSPVEMPWISEVKGLIECYLGGQGMGWSVANIITGKTCPSGKLAETFPVKLEHNPSYLNFPGVGDRVSYAEGVFVGYRYYDTKCIEPLFPFGHGLSYSSFEYSNMEIRKMSDENETDIMVTCDIKNTGPYFAKEIVQLYVKDCESRIPRPYKELKGFRKISLKPDEIKTVEFTLNERSFAYYDVDLKKWHVEGGEFIIMLGSSSKDIRLEGLISIVSETMEPKMEYHENSLVGDILQNNSSKEIMLNVLSKMMEKKSRIEDVNPEMKAAMMRYMPLRALKYFAHGKITDETIEILLKQLNIKR